MNDEELMQKIDGIMLQSVKQTEQIYNLCKEHFQEGWPVKNSPTPINPKMEKALNEANALLDEVEVDRDRWKKLAHTRLIEIEKLQAELKECENTADMETQGSETDRHALARRLRERVALLEKHGSGVIHAC